MMNRGNMHDHTPRAGSHRAQVAGLHRSALPGVRACVCVCMCLCICVVGLSNIDQKTHVPAQEPTRQHLAAGEFCRRLRPHFLY